MKGGGVELELELEGDFNKGASNWLLPPLLAKDKVSKGLGGVGYRDFDFELELGFDGGQHFPSQHGMLYNNGGYKNAKKELKKNKK